ncbi:MAG: 23S rRNA (adenine(2503)-C(2))-methyltransferase RlmN [Bacteroidales bacterium]|nr:23S rRNA (adenine(2503)-C(2))-methyltransferase RlmN [Bacteroidales bacterium]
MTDKINLLGQTLPQLQTLCADMGFPRFTAKQLCDWLYKKRIDSIDAMSNLSLAQRAKLNETAYIGRSHPVNCQVSRDGTKKYLFQVWNAEERGHSHVEAVYIPENKISEIRAQSPDSSRATLCISCQVGCKMGCSFCVTGQQGFHGSLTAGDILNQIFSIPECEQLTNIVFMGMGEPMDNLDAVLDACAVLTSDWGLAWSPKRITVSSVGIIPGLKRFLDECQCHLAISLHNPVPQERLEIMPMQKAYPLAEVLALLRHYDWSGQRRLSFEYTMFRGMNDDLAHAQRLTELLRGLDCRVNLIRFHSSPGTPFQTSTPTTIKNFQEYLNRHGVTCTLRASRGEDIDAACGLLAGKER